MSPEELIGGLAQVWSSLVALGEDLAPVDWEQPTDCPGWTVRDQYAHMIGTESALLGDPVPPPLTAAHAHNRMGEVNEGWVDPLRGQPGAAVLKAFRAVTARRLVALRAMTSEEWEAPTDTPVGPGTYALFMEIRIFDCWVHEQDVRSALDRPGHLDGPIADVAMARLSGSLGFVVGKRVGAPEGSTVVVELEPPLGRRLAVAVAGGRAGAAEAPESPSVRIRTDGETWMRLSTGRTSAADAIDEGRIAFEGDASLGRAVVEQLNVTP
jgi:uncharacterized protein (TIGR03083 family)